MQTYESVVSLCKKEIKSIKERDGELSPTAYIVCEIISRLKTITSWPERNPHETLGCSIRKIVESIIKGEIKAEPKETVPFDANYDVDWKDSKKVYRYVKEQIHPATHYQKLRKKVS